MAIKKITTTSFVSRASKVHNNQYDYCRTVYKNCKTNVEIICKVHGSFFQMPTKHVNEETGCPACAKRPIITTEIFIDRAKQAHGDLYDYSNVDYVSFSHKVEIICKKHGSFVQSPENHFRHKHKCPLCNFELASTRGIGGYNEHTLSNDIRGQLYCVEMISEDDHYFKIGITKNDYTKRLGNHGCEIKLIASLSGGLLDLYKKEQQILKEMAEHRFKHRPKNSWARKMGWTECFPLKVGPTLIETFKRSLLQD